MYYLVSVFTKTKVFVNYYYNTFGKFKHDYKVIILRKGIGIKSQKTMQTS